MVTARSGRDPDQRAHMVADRDGIALDPVHETAADRCGKVLGLGREMSGRALGLGHETVAYRRSRALDWRARMAAEWRSRTLGPGREMEVDQSGRALGSYHVKVSDRSYSAHG
jgi:hypothetical protein